MKTLALDADDTLWENIDFFLKAQSGLCELLKDYVPASEVESKLFAKESQNVPLYGYGTKSFVLSMVELAIDLTDGCEAARARGQGFTSEKADFGAAHVQSGTDLVGLPSSVVLKILDLGRDILRHPIHLLRGVEETVPILAQQYRLIVATKGELLEQEQKLERSGLKPYVEFMHVMSNKRVDDYRRLIDLLRVAPEDFIMVGNSLKSDVLPVIELGGTGVYIPHHYTWEHEAVDPEISEKYHYIQLEHFGELAEALESGKL